MTNKVIPEPGVNLIYIGCGNILEKKSAIDEGTHAHT